MDGGTVFHVANCSTIIMDGGTVFHVVNCYYVNWLKM